MSHFPFLSLPLELREQIYALYFKPADRLVHSDAFNVKGFFGGVYNFDFELYRVSRQIYAEAKRVWERENVFVKIATPWPSAGMYHIYYAAEDTLMFGDGAGMYRVYLMSEEDLEWDEEGLGTGECLHLGNSVWFWIDANLSLYSVFFFMMGSADSDIRISQPYHI